MIHFLKRFWTQRQKPSQREKKVCGLLQVLDLPSLASRSRFFASLASNLLYHIHVFNKKNSLTPLKKVDSFIGHTDIALLGIKPIMHRIRFSKIRIRKIRVILATWNLTFFISDTFIYFFRRFQKRSSQLRTYREMIRFVVYVIIIYNYFAGKL